MIVLYFYKENKNIELTSWKNAYKKISRAIGQSLLLTVYILNYFD